MADFAFDVGIDIGESGFQALDSTISRFISGGLLGEASRAFGELESKARSLNMAISEISGVSDRAADSYRRLSLAGNQASQSLRDALVNISAPVAEEAAEQLNAFNRARQRGFFDPSNIENFLRFDPVGRAAIEVTPERARARAGIRESMITDVQQRARERREEINSRFAEQGARRQRGFDLEERIESRQNIARLRVEALDREREQQLRATRVDPSLDARRFMDTMASRRDDINEQFRDRKRAIQRSSQEGIRDLRRASQADESNIRQEAILEQLKIAVEKAVTILENLPARAFDPVESVK